MHHHRFAAWVLLVFIGSCQTAPRTPAALAPAAIAVAFTPVSEPPPVGLPPLAVLDYGPIGRTDAKADIHVRFNQAVVALGDGADGGMQIAIEPKLAGRSFWRTPDLLVFEPDGLSPATRYTVQVQTQANVGAASAALLTSQPLSWTFETAGPEVLALWQEWELHDLTGQQEIYLGLSQPVELANLQKHLRVSAAKTDEKTATVRDVPVRIAVLAPTEVQHHQKLRWFIGKERDASGRFFVLRPVKRWPFSSKVTLEVKAGLVGQLGPVPSASDWKNWFTTAQPPTLGQIRTSGSEDEESFDGKIQLEFGTLVAQSEFRHIRVSPRPRDLKIQGSKDEEGSWAATLVGSFDRGRTYAVHLAPQMRGTNGYTVGDGTGGRPLVRKFVIPGQEGLRLSKQGIFPATIPPLIGVQARYVKAVRVKAMVLSAQEEAAWQLDPTWRWSDNKDRAKKVQSLFAAAQPPRLKSKPYTLTPTGKTQAAEFVVDLRDLVGATRGGILVEVQATTLVPSPTGVAKQPAPRYAHYSITDLAPIALNSLTRTLIKAVRLSDSQPVAGVEVQRYNKDAANLVTIGRTDSQGMLVIERTGAAPEALLEDAVLVVSAPDGQDYAAQRIGSAWGGPRNGKKSPRLALGERLMLRLVTERNVYRPADSVHVVGWAMIETPFTRSNLRPVEAGTTVGLTLWDQAHKVVAKESAQVDGDGKFWATLPTFKQTQLGYLVVGAEVLGTTQTSRLTLEDFRTPEFQVTAQPVRPWIVAGEPAQIRVAAVQYSGLPITIGELTHRTQCNQVLAEVPGLEPGWVAGATTYRYQSHNNYTRGEVAKEAAGQRGNATFTAQIPELSPAVQQCTVTLQVQDASHQVMGTVAQVGIHPASTYLAVRPPVAVHAGDRGTVALRAVDPQGRRKSAKGVKVEVVRSWREEVRSKEEGRVFTHWAERRDPAITCQLDISAGKDGECALGALVEGEYTIEVVGKDEQGRQAITQGSFYVGKRPTPGAKTTRPVPPPAEHLAMQIQGTQSPVKNDYQYRNSRVAVGDRIRVVLTSPCSATTGLLWLARAGIREQHEFQLVDHTAALDFVTDDSWTPHVAVEALVVCPGKEQPTLETVSQTIDQPPQQRELAVKLEAPAQARPDESIPVTVRVRDATDKPLAGVHVSLWAVDEAVLSLQHYQVQSPLPGFVPDRHAETNTLHGFDLLMGPFQPGKVDLFWSDRRVYPMSGRATAMGMDGEASPLKGAALLPPARARFETAPVFLADFPLAADGTAKTSVRLPDNLTTFRITAIASARLADGSSPGRFGLAEKPVQVSLPFIVRPAFPRLLRPNDTAEIAAIVQNQTGRDGRLVVEAVIKAGAKAPTLALLGPARVEVPLASGAETRVPFLVRALAAGTPEVELRARLESTQPKSPPIASDTVRLPIPVEPEPTLVDRVALYGSLASDQATAVQTRFPKAVQPGVGGISVSASASLLGDLQDAMAYLVDYPYGCIEQTASRVLALLAAQQIARRQALPIDQPAKLLADGIARIATMQTEDGGFAYWPESRVVHPYATAFTTWALLLAKRNGAAVPEAVIDRALAFLEKSLTGDGTLAVQTERAIGLQILAEAGRPLPAEAVQAVYAQRDKLPLFSRTLLLMALHRTASDDPRLRTMVEELLGSISELPATAHVREVNWWGLDQVFHSETRSDAMALLALLQALPDHAVVSKLVRGLLEHRLAGRWRNTQENAYGILAVLEYARQFEADNAAFEAESWVNDKVILHASFGPQPEGKASGFLSMADILALGKPPTVVLRRQGQGRMYYRLGTEWLPSGDALPARAQGLEVTRVVRTGTAQAITSVRAGEALAFDLTISNRTQLNYVVVNVPVPAGLEPVLENLGKGHQASTLAGAQEHWTSYQERRPDRVLLFADTLQPGIHRHTIQLRATTPGSYALPPARAEAMYTPEVYGRSESTQLVVK